MAKQKSGLGRGLNALFDDSSLSAAPRQEEHKKEVKVEVPVKETPATKPEEVKTVTNEVPAQSQPKPVPSTQPQTKSNSSSIYFSEDALENAKVVSREARPKQENRGQSSRREHSGSFFQHKSSKSVTAQASRPSVPANKSYKVANPVNQTQRLGVSSHQQATLIPANSEQKARESQIDNKAVVAEKKAAPEKPKDEKGMTGVVPLDKVQPNPDQPRTNFKPEEIEELANSIKKEGLLQPILVRKVGDRYQIIAGERRWQACKSLKMTEIPVRFWAADNDKALELALIENIQRTDLNPIEEAYGYRRLMERRGMTQSEVAQTVSKGRSTIANALRLLDLPEEAQQLLFEEKITAGHARAILSIPDAEGRKTLTNKLMSEKLSVRETEAIARLLSGRAQTKEDGAKKRVPAPASFKKAARGLTRFLSVPVRVKTVQGKNKIEIQFKDEEELERILNLIAENADSKAAQTSES